MKSANKVVCVYNMLALLNPKQNKVACLLVAKSDNAHLKRPSRLAPRLYKGR